MRKNTKVIQIFGIRGLLTLAFIGVCLFAGFVIFPGLVAMKVWNHFALQYMLFPAINIYQGCLLWVIAALSIYLISGQKLFVSFEAPKALDKKELETLLKRVHEQKEFAQKVLINADEIKKMKDKIEAEKVRLQDEDKKSEEKL